MSTEFSFLLADLATFAGLIPCLVALFRIKASSVHRLLAILVWGGTAIALAAYILGSYSYQNLFLLHVYTLLSFILTTLLYRSVLPKKAILVLLVAFSLFAAYNSIWVDKLITFNVLNRSVSAFIMLFYPLIYFIKTLQEVKEQRLELQPLFWLSIGVLFYNAGSFFIFLFSRDIVPFEELWLNYFGIHSMFTILLYTFYTIALWVRPRS